jgi:hypothetical protein
MAKIMKEMGFVKKEFQVYEEKYNIPFKDEICA